MRSFLLLPLFAVLVFSCRKNKTDIQDPIPNNQSLAWSKTLGGSEKDYGNAIVQLASGEYVMAGSTRSTDGDLSGSRVVFDTWLTKLDQTGNKLWSMNYGSNSDKFTTALAGTSDGGFLIGGYSGFLIGYNGISRDSFPNFGWILKTDASGNKQWQINSPVDSKVLGVTSVSGASLIVGYKINTQGNYDGWVQKVDNGGTILWDKNFGGIGEDQLYSISSTTDGGYILAGFSSSADIATNRGDFDGWILKLDASGNKVWTKTFGGTNRDQFKSIISTSDGNFVVVGQSNSNDGDISLNRGGFDEWIVKVDVSGNKIWSKTFGGNLNEITTSVANAPDGGYVVAGYTNSITHDVTRPSTDWGGWLVKVDNNGNKTTSSTYGDLFDNVLDKMIVTQDGGYIFTGHTDKSSNPVVTNYDGWIVKVGNL